MSFILELANIGASGVLRLWCYMLRVLVSKYFGRAVCFAGSCGFSGHVKIVGSVSQRGSCSSLTTARQGAAPDRLQPCFPFVPRSTSGFSARDLVVGLRRAARLRVVSVYVKMVLHRHNKCTGNRPHGQNTKIRPHLFCFWYCSQYNCKIGWPNHFTPTSRFSSQGASARYLRN